MIRRPPRSTRVRSSAASDVYKRQDSRQWSGDRRDHDDLAAFPANHLREQCLRAIHSPIHVHAPHPLAHVGAHLRERHFGSYLAALFTRISTVSKTSMTSTAAVSTAASSLMSNRHPRAGRPCSAAMRSTVSPMVSKTSHRHTVAPSAANTLAIPSPFPLAPPVLPPHFPSACQPRSPQIRPNNGGSRTTRR